MPRPVYSSSFIVRKGATGTDAKVTVPHGYVFVVKCISVFSTPSFGRIETFFEQLDYGVTLKKHSVDVGGVLSEIDLCTFTFNEGETFGWRVISNAGEGADFYAGGYALTLP